MNILPLKMKGPLLKPDDLGWQASVIFPLASALSVLASTAMWGTMSENGRLVFCAITMSVETHTDQGFALLKDHGIYTKRGRGGVNIMFQ